MSRRTRLKSLPKERFSINHHFSYGASTSHFPRSYSIIGRDIKFPTSLLPLCTNSKLCYVGTVGQFLESIKKAQINFETFKEVSISFNGQKYQSSSTILNLVVFSFSICCFCLSYLPKTSPYRNTLYPKYKFDHYQQLANIIAKFATVDTLIINFQDNDINPTKAAVVQDALMKSNIKKVVLRNLTYFIEVQGVKTLFQRVRAKKDMRFAFVWQQLVLQSYKTSFNEQQERLVSLNEQQC